MRTNETNVIQQNNSKLTLQVMNDLTVQLYSNPKFDFLMDTETVAKGYGVSINAIHSHRCRYFDEFKENTHYATASALAICKSENSIPSNKVFWTKSGVIRLGFFIKSERAKAFRDWAEKVVLEVTAPSVALPPATPRKHNRITPARMISILSDVAKIDDKALRLSLISKLGV